MDELDNSNESEVTQEESQPIETRDIIERELDKVEQQTEVAQETQQTQETKEAKNQWQRCHSGNKRIQAPVQLFHPSLGGLRAYRSPSSQRNVGHAVT